jgi:hypothetical protein
MRPILIALAMATAALAFGARSGNAQGWYNNRWCTDGGGVDEGSHLECSYATWEQCQASARGRGQYCTENPDIVRARIYNSDPRASGRQRKN